MSDLRPAVPEALPRPAVAPADPYAVPEPARRTLDNGLTVLAYDLPGQYVHSIRLAMPLPLRVEPRESEGVATIMARTLDEGTGRHTATEFARLLERRGVAYGAGAGDSGLSVEVDVAKGHLDYALDLLSQTLTEPAFPAEEVGRHVSTRLAEVEQERSMAAHRAASQFAATYFDPATRASRPVGGSAETVAGLTHDDVAGFHARHVGPEGATVVISGDLSALDPFAAIERALGGWRPSQDRVAPGPWVAAPVAPDRIGVVIVDRPGSVQTELMVGCPGPDRHVDTGWAPYPMLAFALGGSPTSRIDALLREDRGYTYGMRSSFRPRRRGGLFVTAGSVRSEVTADALGLLLGVLDGARDGFTEAETRQAAHFLVLTAPSRFATADAVADEAASLSYDGLGTDFTSRTLAGIDRMDPEGLGAAYRRFVDGAWTIVLVGDAATFADGVGALGRGALRVVAN